MEMINENPPSAYPKIVDTSDVYVEKLNEAVCKVFEAVYPDKVRRILNAAIGSITSTSSLSCGVSFLNGLNKTPKSIVDKILKVRHRNDRATREAFVIWSDVDKSAEDIGQKAYYIGSGQMLHDYIVEHKLGIVHQFGPQLNPNSGNKIKFYLWEPPHESFKPIDAYMPVYRKILTKDVYGKLRVYQPDHRFDGIIDDEDY